MSANWPWVELGLDGPNDERAVRRAYAARLKAIDRDNAAAFQKLRSAYDAARVRAKQAAPKRPSMSELARNGQPGLISFDISDRKSRDWMDVEESNETHEAAEKIPSEAEGADNNDATEPKHRPEPEREPFPENPPNTDLDALHSLWPSETRALYMQRLREAVRPVFGGRTDDLRELLSLAMAQEFEFRRQIEWQVFSVLEQHVRKSPDGLINLGPNLGRVLEYEFHWYSDGVGFQRRFRGRAVLGKIVEELHGAVGKPLQQKRQQDWTKNLHYVGAFALCWAVTAVFWGYTNDDYSAHDYFSIGLILVPAMLGAWFVSAVAFIAFDFVANHIFGSRFAAPLHRKWRDVLQKRPRLARIDGLVFRAMTNPLAREKIVIWLAAALLSAATIAISFS
jgi:hypothetical protein